MTDDAIVVDSVTKLFKIYQERNQSIKGALLRGARSRYDEFAAVQDVSFTVPRGSTFGLVGSNGSGKSTLLKCVAGILEPDSGRITIQGRMAAMLEVGSGFHSELSGRENIYLNASILGMTRREIDAKFDSIIEFSGVERFIDTPVKNYSSGMYVRLGFSVAIHTQPDVLVVDEVFSVGDADFQAKSRAKFDELRREGTTILLVSHNNSLIRSFCDRLAWLEQGVLRSVGAVEEVLEEFQGKSTKVEQPDGSVLSGDGTAQIRALEITGAEGAPRDQITPDEPVTLRMQFDVSERLPTPMFTVSVTNMDGRVVYRANSYDLGFRPEAIEVGSHEITLPLAQLPLGAGEFELNGDVRAMGRTSPASHIEKSSRFRVVRGEFHSARSLMQLPTEMRLSTQ